MKMTEHNEHSGSHEHGEHHDHSRKEHEHHEHKELHIFVNRRKFDRGEGVKEDMTGAQIAALVGVPPENAVVREEQPDKHEIGVADTVHVKNGEHFLVTRKVVEGGYVA
jgi:hypothetical protein